jgi:hypothetical protein
MSCTDEIIGKHTAVGDAKGGRRAPCPHVPSVLRHTGWHPHWSAVSASARSHGLSTARLTNLTRYGYAARLPLVSVAVARYSRNRCARDWPTCSAARIARTEGMRSSARSSASTTAARSPSGSVAEPSRGLGLTADTCLPRMIIIRSSIRSLPARPQAMRPQPRRSGHCLDDVRRSRQASRRCPGRAATSRARQLASSVGPSRASPSNSHR